MRTRSRKLSLLESMLTELMRMVVINLKDKDILSFKLVSRITYRTTKNKDGSDVVSLEDIGQCCECDKLLSRSVLYRKPAYLRCSEVSPHICEACAKWVDEDAVQDCAECGCPDNISRMLRIPDNIIFDTTYELLSYLCQDCTEVSDDSHPPCDGCGLKLSGGEGTRFCSGSGEAQEHYFCDSCLEDGRKKAKTLGWKLDSSKKLGLLSDQAPDESSK